MKEFEVTLSDGSTELWVEIKNGDGFSAMPKSVWDELEAAKEASGTLS